MKMECEVIQDLLPLYHDQVCSEKSAELVREHLSQCEGCRDYLENLDRELNLGDSVEKVKPLGNVKKRIRKMGWMAFGAGILAAVVLIYVFFAGMARYSAFMDHLLYLMGRGMTVLGAVALVFGLGILMVYRNFKGKNRPFPWKKAILTMLLAGWAVLLLYVTVFQGSFGGGARWLNLQPFLMLREALNRFTPQTWLNLLINLLPFVPLGILLPLLFPKTEKWYGILAAGLGTALAMELLQYVTAEGICDIDDLILDTMGTMLGWSFLMLVLSLKRRKSLGRSLSYLAVPGAYILAAAVIFGGYYLQPYGNLPDAPIRNPDLSGVRWNLQTKLESTEGSAPVYKVGRMDRETSEAFAAEFAEKMDISFNDIYYEDSMIIYANHYTGDFLHQYYLDGSWEYSLNRDTAPVFENPYEEREKLLDVLEKMGISVPENAEFTAEGDDTIAVHLRIWVDEEAENASRRHGEIECRFMNEDGKLRLSQVHNAVFTLEPVQEEAIISPQEAYELIAGQSFYGRWLSEEKVGLTVSKCVLDWQFDTKGFCQPVYRFSLTNEENSSQWLDYVPALS